MDSRFHLKVDFEIYGKKFGWDCSLNWSAEPGELDPRIAEWFLTRHAEAYVEHEAKKIAEYFAERHAEQLKQSDLAELRRLREKYPDA